MWCFVTPTRKHYTTEQSKVLQLWKKQQQQHQIYLLPLSPQHGGHTSIHPAGLQAGFRSALRQLPLLSRTELIAMHSPRGPKCSSYYRGFQQHWCPATRKTFFLQQRSGYYFSCWWLKGNHTPCFQLQSWLNETSEMGGSCFKALERLLKEPLRKPSGKQAIEGVWSKIGIKLW